MATEPKSEGEANAAERQNQPESPQPWEEAVWRAYCKGNRRLGTLQRIAAANGGPDSWHSMERFVKKMLAALVIDRIVDEDRADYEAGVEADLEDADAVFNKAFGSDQLNAAVGALGKRLDAREKLAQSRFVITDRKAVNVTGTLGWLELVEEAGKEKEAQEDGSRDSADGT